MSRAVKNGLLFESIATLPAASSNNGVVMQGSNGILFFSNGTVWLPLNRRYPASASVANSSGLNTVETYISAAFPIPANTLVAGMAFRVTAYGTCTSTVANLSTFTVRFGTAGTTSDATVLAATCTAAASGTTIPFKFEAIVTIRTIGATGTVTASVQIVNNGVTGISAAAVTVAGTGSTLTMNTTVANFLGLSYKSAASTTTSTFDQVVVEQVE